jgi:hypothetical protein
MLQKYDRMSVIFQFYETFIKVIGQSSCRKQSVVD